jgi:uncharacterized Ntn-hydrolase superfamily protein
MTYSIVARDPETGRFGIAVQSHFLGVGPVVPWLAPGVGAVATQASVNVSLGPLGLDLLRAGRSADEALTALLASDDRPGVRQVGLVDAGGRAAAHTGSECIPAAGHLVGDGFTVQGNLLLSDSCWPAMAEAYRDALAEGEPLVERLVRALEAAEREGGDVRGRQSAAIKIAAADPLARTRLGNGLLMDLRIEDHADPVPELRRIVTMQLAYDLLDEEGDEAHDGMSADERYVRSRVLAPEAYELVFWRGIELGVAGDIETARTELRIAFAADERWRTTLQHLADVSREGVTPQLAELLLAD